jgi:hypothetical protein
MTLTSTPTGGGRGWAQAGGCRRPRGLGPHLEQPTRARLGAKHGGPAAYGNVCGYGAVRQQDRGRGRGTGAAVAQRLGAGLAPGGEVICTCPCIFSIENHYVNIQRGAQKPQMTSPLGARRDLAGDAGARKGELAATKIRGAKRRGRCRHYRAALYISSVIPYIKLQGHLIMTLPSTPYIS